MHAVLSPSSAHSWMRCFGGPAFTMGMPDKGSHYADEGTAAHRLATWCFEDGVEALTFLGQTIEVGPSAFEVTTEMAEHVQGFVDYVLGIAEGRQLFVEQKLPIGFLTGEEGATGTGDVVIVDGAIGHLWSIDFKYGAGVKVSATDNEQTRIYALGAMHKFDTLAEFNTVHMGIYQPRMNNIDFEVMDAARLRTFGNNVCTSAVMAQEAIVLVQARATPGELYKAGYLKPSAKACMWCRGKATCPAARAEVMEITTGSADAADFAHLIQPGPETGDNYLTVAMDAVDRIEDWCRAIRAEVEQRLFAGKPVPGWKVVTGKQGDRKWADEEAVIKRLKSFEVPATDMYKPQSLVGIPAIEKLFKKHPIRWEEMQKLISRAPGKPSVAPATDPRPALALTSTADDLRAASMR